MVPSGDDSVSKVILRRELAPIDPTLHPVASVFGTTETTISCRPVNRTDQVLSLELSLQMTLPMPPQDEHLPDRIEAHVHRAGLEIQRQLFRALIEKADQELVLQQRHGRGGVGVQRRGTRPFTFKTIFGEVTVQRSRILHKKDGTIEVPSARAWGTPHQLMI